MAMMRPSSPLGATFPSPKVTNGSASDIGPVKVGYFATTRVVRARLRPFLRFLAASAGMLAPIARISSIDMIFLKFNVL